MLSPKFRRNYSSLVTMKRTTRKTVRFTDNSMVPQRRLLLPFLVSIPLMWSSEWIKFFDVVVSAFLSCGEPAATYYSYTKSTPKSNNSNCNKNNIADACVHHTGLYKVTLLILETRSVGQFICPPLVTCSSHLLQ